MARLDAEEALGTVARIGLALSGGNDRARALAALERQAGGSAASHPQPSQRPRSLPQLGLGMVTRG